MATLIDTASHIQDLYKQNYGANDDFFDIDDFVFWVATTYSELINKQYQVVRQQNKQLDGFANIEIPASWLVEQEITLTKDPIRRNQYFAKLKYPVFSFDWDNAANGLQGVHSIGTHHCLYRKISLNERRFKQILPDISAMLFYLNSPDEIIFWGGKEGAKALIQYVPKVVGQENDCILSDNIITPLADAVLMRMFQAKNGNFIQKLDDQNQNIVPGQQTNPAVPGGK